MKKYKILISILLNFELLANTVIPYDFKEARIKSDPKNIVLLKSNTELIRADNLVDLLRDFVKAGRPSRLVGSPGHEKVSEFLVKKIRELDPNADNLIHVDSFVPDAAKAIALYQNDFDREIKGKYQSTHLEYRKWDNFTKQMINLVNKRKDTGGKNIIWEKRGSEAPNDIIVIGAHYDTIAHDHKTLVVNEEAIMPGADDNGSGVAIALAMIQVLSRLNLKKTVRVVFFDWQEIGFLGSHAFIKKYLKEFKDKNFLGFINLEMLGHDSKSTDIEKRTGNMALYIRKKGEIGSSDDLKLANQLMKIGQKMTPAVRFELLKNSFNSSDHINFWENGLPAVTFTQNWEKDFNKERYHTSNDFVETINRNTLFRSYQYILGAVAAMALGFQ